jgi:hypothetical protein
VAKRKKPEHSRRDADAGGRGGRAMSYNGKERSSDTRREHPAPRHHHQGAAAADLLLPSFRRIWLMKAARLAGRRRIRRADVTTLPDATPDFRYIEGPALRGSIDELPSGELSASSFDPGYILPNKERP